MVKKSAPKPTQRKPNEQSPNKRRLSIIIAVAIVICLPLLWFLVHNPSLYSVDKETVGSQVSSSLDAVRLAHAPAYRAVADGGCNDGNSVGLAVVATCSMVGYQYYESNGDISPDLQTLKSLISKNGWSVSPVTFGSNTLDYSKNVTGNQPPSPYLPPQLYLTIYRQQQDDTSVDELIKEGKIKPLADGVTLYGVRVTETYWSCRDGSALTLSCMPPSQPHP